MFVEAEAGAMAHPLAHHFFFLPDTTVYDVPALGASASVGVGVYFL
jgi:hypothetical protein